MELSMAYREGGGGGGIHSVSAYYCNGRKDAAPSLLVAPATEPDCLRLRPRTTAATQV
jgi:hypothetical protein